MNTPPANLLAALEAADMLEINGLYAWQFELVLDAQPNAERALLIECMDGRTLRKWQFSRAELLAATFSPATQSWNLTGSSGAHELKCLSGVTADNSEQAEDPEDA
ncbi:DUF5629 family protein [Pseudomonas sp. 2FE]|uniref:DUF5629 family protein n=1 Tax=Pseudomonas sp. 2FE TaxID=2502190 RepID=UPI0010F9C882|nr:DUF5629 family protein [Pseudomonas sp. 2FE]